jgi:type III pantothenate kinase
MILCLDIGNTQIHGGVFDSETLVFQFRKTSKDQSSSDEYGVFLRTVLRENDVDPREIKRISVCSVVPSVVHSIRNACLKYFSVTPFFLQAGAKTGLKIKYKNPVEVGSDRIANAIAATNKFPNQNIIIVDFGTATTICVVSKDKDYIGGSILPGIRISMEALESKTAKLPKVEILKQPSVIGQTTVDSIQSGLYFGQLGMVKEIVERSRREAFPSEPVLIIGTGGFASLFDKETLFEIAIPDLALRGLAIATEMNVPKTQKDTSTLVVETMPI